MIIDQQLCRSGSHLEAAAAAVGGGRMGNCTSTGGGSSSDSEEQRRPNARPPLVISDNVPTGSSGAAIGRSPAPAPSTKPPTAGRATSGLVKIVPIASTRRSEPQAKSQPQSQPQPELLPQPTTPAAAVRLPKPSVNADAGPELGSVLGKPLRDVRQEYTFGKELGRGHFGITYLVFHTQTQERFACKTIHKQKLQSRQDMEDLRREVQIMHHVSGYDNIVQLRGAYEDRYSVSLVMELCEGGELLDRILKQKHYSEREAASVCRTMVRVVQICHSLGVMHRDLKPENFLYANPTKDSPLKLIDFGLSTFYSPGKKFSDFVGSIYYIAPEVICRSYGPEIDIWSVGVILYILLCGEPPFWAETDQGILDAIEVGQFNFDNEPWPSISEDAKYVIRQMLKYDPNERCTPASILQHPWMREDGVASDAPIDNIVLSRMKQFSTMNKMKKLALKVIAESLSEEEITGLKEIFKAMDTNEDGQITLDELKMGLSLLGSNLAESEVSQLMQAVDADRNGSLDYLEFITATIQLNKKTKNDRLWSTFRYFDKDNSGYITTDELKEVLTNHGIRDYDSVEDIIKEVDTDNDGRINYDEFVAMMR